MKLEQATASTISDLWSRTEPRVRQSKYLEEAAQEWVSTVHTTFENAVVIARIFVTVPFSDLPDPNKKFVQQLVESKAAASELKPTTPVLSLVGSHGREANWNDRRNSQGHVGIPLISSSFVDDIPMISRLLKQLGVPVDWVDSHDSQAIVNAIGSTVGLFFVENASQATDDQGRKIIAAQDFVSSYSVKSVFGTGGAYPNGQMVVIVVFCDDTLSKTVAEHFLTPTTLFINQTKSLVESASVFS